MSIISRLLGRKKPSTERIDRIKEEKRQLRGELAQATVTFERRRNRVHKMAEEAIESMHTEGQR